MKVVVDTNIVFSAVLNSNSRIAHILIGGKRHFKFYSCDFLRAELLQHRPKLRKLTGLSPTELDEVIDKVTKNVTFINEGSLPASLFARTEALLAGNDLKDVPFVALTIHLRARLWTGDKRLVSKLPDRLSKSALSTLELVEKLNTKRG